MKIITIPPDVTLSREDRVEAARHGQQVPETIRFTDWLKSAIYAFEFFGKGLKNIRMGDKLCSKVESVNGDKTITFEDEEYGCLCDAVKSAGSSTILARRMIPFHEAVLEKAEDVKK